MEISAKSFCEGIFDDVNSALMYASFAWRLAYSEGFDQVQGIGIMALNSAQGLANQESGGWLNEWFIDWNWFRGIDFVLKEEERNDLFEKFFLFLFLKKRYIYQ